MIFIKNIAENLYPAIQFLIPKGIATLLTGNRIFFIQHSCFHKKKPKLEMSLGHIT